MNLVALAVTPTEVHCNDEDYYKDKGADAEDNTKVARFLLGTSHSAIFLPSP